MSEKIIIKKLREANCCHNCRKSKHDSSCDVGSIICILDGAEEADHMICNHYDSPKEYKVKGHGSALQSELDKIQKQLKRNDEYENT